MTDSDRRNTAARFALLSALAFLVMMTYAIARPATE